MIDISIKFTFGKPPIKIKYYNKKKPKLTDIQKISNLKLKILEKRVGKTYFEILS